MAAYRQCETENLDYAVRSDVVDLEVPGHAGHMYRRNGLGTRNGIPSLAVRAWSTPNARGVAGHRSWRLPAWR